MKWQPIESAPKDGRFIWVWNPHQPELMRRVRWGRVVNTRQHEDWVTSRGCALSWESTHWIELEPPK